MPYGSNAVRLRAFKGNFGSLKVTGAPTTLYVALLRHATTPATVLGTEPDSTGAYARVAFTNDDSEWTYTADGGYNTNERRWPLTSGIYSITDPLNQWAFYDNSSGGNLIAFGALTTTITVTGANDQPLIPAVGLPLTIGT